MTGDKNKFTSLTLKDGENVKFDDNSKGKIIGIGNIGKTHSLVIEDVLLVVAQKIRTCQYGITLKLSKLDLVKGLPVTKFVKDKICDACQLGKQTKSSFKKKKVISTSRPLELLHMDLFGPIRTASLSGKLYAFVIVDDYSRYTWVLFIAHKNEAHKAFVKHCRRIQNEKRFYAWKT